MPDGGGFAINHDELTAHQQRLRGLLDRVEAAGAASAETGADPLAYGQIGNATLLSAFCISAENDGVDMLRQVHAATQDHIARVGEWACDWQGREGYAVTLFNDAVMRDAGR